MKFKLVARKNPQDRKLNAKYYAQPEYNGTVDIDFMARQISGRSSLTAGDIKNVLSQFLEEIPTFMLLGYSVKLNELGSFRISFSSDGAENPEAFKTTQIKEVRVIYVPDRSVRTRVLDDITFEHGKSAASTPEPEPTPPVAK